MKCDTLISMKALEDFLSRNPKKVLIFDFDETLFYLKLPWSVYHEKQSKILSKYDSDLFEQLSKDLTMSGLTNHFVEQFGQTVKEEIIEWSTSFESTYLEGVEENKQLIHFVNKYHQQYHFFVWSSNVTQTITPVLKENKLLKYFDKVIGKDLVTFTKPQGDGFELVQKELQQSVPQTKFSRTDYLMIGNSITSDKGAAETVGIDFFLIDYF